MKYSQYHEIRSLLESDQAQSYGFDINEWDKLSPKEKVDELNEAGLLAAIGGAGLLAKIGLGAGAGLLSLGIAFRKKLLSKGMKKVYIMKLTKLSHKFKEEATAALQRAYAKLIEAKREILKKAGVKKISDLPDDEKVQVGNIEKQIVKVFNSTIDKLADLKTKQVDLMIDKKKSISDQDKIALKFTWETLSVEAKVALLADLMKSKVIETDEVTSLVNDAADKKKEEHEKKMNEILKKLKTEGGNKLKMGEKYIYTSDKGKEINLKLEDVKDDGIEFSYVDSPEKDNVTISKDDLKGKLKSSSKSKGGVDYEAASSTK